MDLDLLDILHNMNVPVLNFATISRMKSNHVIIIS